MHITGEKIGCFHNKSFLKKKIFAYVYKKAMLINFGTRMKRFACLAKETIVFSHLLATTIMIKTHGQQTALQIFIS